MSDILYVASGLLIGLAFKGGLFLFAIPGALIALVLAWLNRPSLPTSKAHTATVPVLRATRTTDATAIGRILRPAVTQTSQTLSARDTFTAFPGDGESSLDKLKGNEIWNKLERDLDPIYRSVLRSIQTLIPKTHSVLLLLKTLDGKSFAIRQFSSTAENEINMNARILDGVGIVGQLASRDVNRILEGDLLNGKSLGYYLTIPAIHSVAGVPMFNNKNQRVGALVIDSLEQNAFNANLIPILDSFASMFHMLTYKTVSYTHLTLPTICSV